AHALAVGRGDELFTAGGAVEEHAVGAVSALNDVAAVTRIPLEGVVAGAHLGDIVALVAVDEVVAVAAQQGVVTVAAEDGVVAGPTIDGHLNQRGQVAGGGELVVAAIHVDDEVFAGADVDGKRRGIEAIEADARAVGGDGERLGAVAAVDFDGVAAG